MLPPHWLVFVLVFLSFTFGHCVSFVQAPHSNTEFPFLVIPGKISPGHIKHTSQVMHTSQVVQVEETLVSKAQMVQNELCTKV